MQVPVTLAEAVLGAKIEVPTPQGTIMLRVPPGTSSGKKLRVKGRGVAPKGADPGDLFAEIQIVLPPHARRRKPRAGRASSTRIGRKNLRNIRAAT